MMVSPASNFDRQTAATEFAFGDKTSVPNCEEFRGINQSFYPSQHRAHQIHVNRCHPWNDDGQSHLAFSQVSSQRHNLVGEDLELVSFPLLEKDHRVCWQT